MRRFAQNLAYETLRSWLARGIRKLLSPLGELELEVYLSKDLGEALDPITPDAAVRILRAGTGDFEQVLRLRDRDEAEERSYRDRWQQGQSCFVAKARGRVVAYNWLTHDYVSDEGLDIVLKPDEVFCLDAFTAEAWRGKRIHPALLFEMLRYAQQTGFRRAYTSVGIANKRSWTTHRRLGWEHDSTLLVFWPRWRARPVLIRVRGSCYPLAGYGAIAPADTARAERQDSRERPLDGVRPRG